jgi:hypothetical protein
MRRHVFDADIALRVITAGSLIAAAAGAIGLTLGGFAFAARVTAITAAALLAVTALTSDSFRRNPSTTARVVVDDRGRELQQEPRPRAGKELFLLPLPSLAVAVVCALLAG